MVPENLRKYQLTDQLFFTAMTHRSFINENPQSQSNERLEFLGDAILEYLISEALYTKFPQHPEGILTGMRSNLVQTQSLANIAEKIELGKHLQLARGEELAGGRKNPSLLENALEALIGAIYLSAGIESTKQFLQDYLFPEIDNLSIETLKDPKSLFQEKIQAQNLPTPIYQILKDEGPDHDKSFTSGVFVNQQLMGEGSGRSKQQAEQAAAQNALQKIDEDQ